MKNVTSDISAPEAMAVYTYNKASGVVFSDVYAMVTVPVSALVVELFRKVSI